MKNVQLSKILALVITVLGVTMVVYHLIFTRTFFQGYIEHQDTHLFFALLLIFLGTLKRKPKLWPLLALLILASIVTTGYIRVFYEALEWRMGIPNTTDLIIGIVLLIICFEATRQAFGILLPIVGLLFIAYAALGQYLPQPFWHFPITLKSMIANYNIGLTGMFGMALGVSANYIFLFIIFGRFLMASGASEFFMGLGRLAGRRFASGPGMTAVVSSALVGTVTGQGSSNVAITGPFTIPLMKKAGYTAEQAGGIETVASAGGSIMPPIMGIVAFVMAEFMGVPYIQVCAMAIIPAMLYYLCVGLFVQLNASKMKIVPVTEEVDLRLMARRAPLFIIPLLIIVVLLVQGYSLILVSFVAVMTILVLSLFQKETRGSPMKWVEACADGATTGAKIAVSCAIIGTVIATVGMTGIGLIFPSMVEELSGGILPYALLMIAVMTIILGCGLPPFASYLIVAMMCVPALVRMDVPFIQAHFFVYFFAVFALITPPIALTAVVAAPIAGASYIKTSFQAVRAGVIAWFLPFLVIWAPGIILQPAAPLQTVTQLIAAFVTVLMLQVTLVGYYLAELNLGERGVAVISVAALIVFIVTVNYILLAIGLIVVILLTLRQLRKRKLLRVASEAGS